MTDISLREAADRIIDIETEAPVRGCSVELFDGLGDPYVAAWFQARPATGTARLYDLSHVILDSYFQILLKDGRRIPETRNMTTPEEYELVVEVPERQIFLDGDARYIIASNRSSNNYYHWMVQTLPGIYWGARTSRTGRIGILAAPLSSWQEESLRLLGLGDVPCVAQEVGRQYVIPRAQFSDFVAGMMTYQVSRAVAATFHGLAARVPPSPGRGRMIYVARTDSQFRPVTNEAELIELLGAMGVTVIVPGAHSLVEQISAFRAADLVIGPHGAGLSNIGFCRPGTRVYELLPRHFANGCFDFLAQSASLRYHASVFGGAASGNPMLQGWAVDLEEVRSRVGGLMAAL